MVFFAKGRLAWIAALVFGIVMIVVGALTPNTFFIVGGALFAAFGLLFLILSLVSGGATD